MTNGKHYCCPACGREYEGAEDIKVVMLRDAELQEAQQKNVILQERVKEALNILEHEIGVRHMIKSDWTMFKKAINILKTSSL